MATTGTQTQNGGDHKSQFHYLQQSKKPLHVLVFLLPLIIAYELALALVLTSSEGVRTNSAHGTLIRAFELFGLTARGGLYLGGVAIVVVLLVWHVLNRDPWKPRLSVVSIMTLESALLTGPLIVIGQFISRNTPANSQLLAQAQSADADALNELLANMAISVGAGLYEELLFRMIIIAMAHTLLVDALKIRSTAGSCIAIVISAIAFTVYHPLQDAAGELDMRKTLFLFVAGLYFGAIFLVRGFGIVVGVHALYDLFVVLQTGSIDPG